MSKKIDFAQIGLKTAGLAAGSVAAAVVQKRFLNNMGQKTAPFILIAAGAFLPMLMPKMKVLEHVGDGMIARGASDAVGEFFPNLVQDTAPVSGPQDVTARVFGIGNIMDLQIEEGTPASVDTETALAGAFSPEQVSVM